MSLDSIETKQMTKRQQINSDETKHRKMEEMGQISQCDNEIMQMEGWKGHNTRKYGIFSNQRTP